MNRSRPILAILALLALSLACGHGPAGPSAPASAGEGAAASDQAAIDLAALARQIDPGQVPPLSSGVPPFLAEIFAQGNGSQFTSEQLAAEASQMADRLTNLHDLSDLNIAQLLTMVYLADQIERRLDHCDLVCLAAAERVYAALDIPWMADPEAFMAEILAMAGQMQTDMPKDQVDAMFAFLRSVFASAARRHRSVAVRILRKAPDSEAATDTLRHLAGAAERGRDYAQAVRLRRAVVARPPSPTKFSDLADLTYSCHLAERLPCAEDALRRARAAADVDASRVTSLERDLAGSRRIVALAGTRGYAERLERADVMVDVGRSEDAAVLFDALIAEKPRDARPLVGKARGWFAQGKPGKAIEMVNKARGLDGRDKAFYELAVGLTFQHLMGMMPKSKSSEEKLLASVLGYLPQLRSDVDGLARLEPGIGAVLRIVVNRLQEVAALIPITDPVVRRRRLVALSRSALDEAMALRQRMPSEPYVYRLIFLAARFGARRGEWAASTIDVPAGVPERDELVVMKAGLLYSQSVAWSDGRHLGDITRALDSLSPEGAKQDPPRQLRADVLALEARLLNKARRWPEAVTAYRTLVAGAAEDDKGRLPNNLGVALWESGDRDGARAAWADSIARGETHQAALLNQLVTADAPDVAQLDPIAAGSDRIGVQAQALHWKVHLAHLGGKQRRAALDKIAELLRGDFIDDAADGGTGVVLEESFNIGVGYSTTDHLIVQLALGRMASLIVPAPVTRTSPARR